MMFIKLSRTIHEDNHVKMKAFTIFALIGVVVGMVTCDIDENTELKGALKNIIIGQSDDDDDSQIEKLCDQDDDMIKCARDYFDSNAKCSVIENPSSDPVVKEIHYVYIPVIKTTVILTNTTYSNLDGDIEEIYINKKTGNLVMSVKFDGVKLESNDSKFFIDRKGKEPKLVSDYVYGTYPVTLTVVIPANSEITSKQLLNYKTSAFPEVEGLKFEIGPNVTKSSDPVVSAVVQGLFNNIPTALQEIFLTGAPDFTLAYLQKYICNFDIPLAYAHNL